MADRLLYHEGSWWIDDDISSEGCRCSLPRRVGDPRNDAAMLKAASPVERAAGITNPPLLAYGGDGREPLWVVYPGAGHSWLKTETHLDFARRVEAFLDQHSRPPAR